MDVLNNKELVGSLLSSSFSWITAIAPPGLCKLILLLVGTCKISSLPVAAFSPLGPVGPFSPFGPTIKFDDGSDSLNQNAYGDMTGLLLLSIKKEGRLCGL